MRFLHALGRGLYRAIAIIGAVGTPPEQMNAQTVLPPDVPRPRPEEYRP